MGSLRLTVCTGILAVAAFAPAAHAADGGAVSVTPGSPAPGTDVALRVRGCSGPEGTAVSPAFVTDARLTGSRGALAGQTRVRSSLTPGAYDVKITCADYVMIGRITVADPGNGPDRGTATDRGTGTSRGASADPGRGAGQGPSAVPGTGQSDEPMRTPAVVSSPTAPVHAGGGGTATHFATVATSESGPDTAEAVTGLGLAGVAALAVGLRAHRGRDGRSTR
ncbi:hypothetical protein A6P39_026125 [Streptomyces sp. FXJ1.172]|uniref:hypothetical protein n=1 Tax=Streptomyces sp. FXJ1.172 TaxID=710705 RepID=UPI0007CFF6CC|nr:hypothetical protein [Streptomyces sp. FXJ1.172]WEO97211.1 hypothetical protein A6P39_026125 [Streptomyces sp. FXJ1.172]